MKDLQKKPDNALAQAVHRLRDTERPMLGKPEAYSIVRRDALADLYEAAGEAA